MKTLLKILAILIVLIIGLLFILPMIYKSQLVELTKNELNKNINATVDFEDIDINIIKSFPDLNISINELSIIGKDVFSKDTLLSANTISLAVDLLSVINNDNYEIKKISIIDPLVNIKVLENGNANYNVSMPETSEVSNQEASDENSTFQLAIKKFSITNGQLSYIDKELNAIANLSGINHTLSGKLGADNVVLFTNTKINNTNLTYEDIPYLKNVAIAYKANIDSDIKNEIYTLGKNELAINTLMIDFDGSVSIVDDDLNLVLKFNSQGNKFKDILSLVPAIYMKDFEDIKTEGEFSVNGFIKGAYNEDRIPSFNISTIVKNGKFQYPDLPKAVSNINIVSNISNKGGLADNTIVDVSKFYMILGDNQLNANFSIKTPVSDPDIVAKATGTIDLDNIGDYYPLEDNDEMGGKLILDLQLEGQLSSIENEKYEDFLAMGSLVAQDVVYSSSAFAKPITISNAQLNFSPQYIDLINFRAKTGNSDFQATGRIDNYLGYYFNTGVLSGNLISSSNYLNIDELITDSNEETDNHEKNSKPDQESENVGTPESIIEIPDNIDFSLSSQFKKLVYDSLEMKDVKGKLIISNKTLQIKNLTMKAVDGRMSLVGSYSTIDIEKPKVDLVVSMQNMSIPMAYKQFAVFRKYIPLTKKTTGLFSADFGFNSILNNNMMPDYSTLNGDGNLSTSKIEIKGLNSLTEIANTLDLVDLKKLEINKILVQFQFTEGKLIVKPTDFKYKNIAAEIEGWTALDQSINYDMSIKVPRSEFGNSANGVLDELIAKGNSLGTNFSLPDEIPLNITIGGTLDNPKIQTKLGSDMGTSIVDQAKKEIEKEIEKQKEELSKEAKAKAQKIIDDADKQAKYLIKEAEKQAKIIRENAAAGEKSLYAETDKQAEGLIAEGKKNGFVAEMAAKEAAKQLKNEVAGQGANIIKEADNKADALIREAKLTSAKIKKEAQKEADKILDK